MLSYLKYRLPIKKLIPVIIINTVIPATKEMPTAAYIKYIPTAISSGKAITFPKA